MTWTTGYTSRWRQVLTAPNWEDWIRTMYMVITFLLSLKMAVAGSPTRMTFGTRSRWNWPQSKEWASTWTTRSITTVKTIRFTWSHLTNMEPMDNSCKLLHGRIRILCHNHKPTIHTMLSTSSVITKKHWVDITWKEWSVIIRKANILPDSMPDANSWSQTIWDL